MHFRNHHELSCALHYAQLRNRGRQASFQCSFTPPYIWMCAQKAGSNTLETCSWDCGWVLWKSAHSAQRVHKVQRVHEVQTPSSLMFGGGSNPTLFATSYIEVITSISKSKTSISGTIFGGGSNQTLFDHLYQSFFFYIGYDIEATKFIYVHESKNLGYRP